MNNTTKILKSQIDNMLEELSTFEPTDPHVFTADCKKYRNIVNVLDTTYNTYRQDTCKNNTDNDVFAFIVKVKNSVNKEITKCDEIGSSVINNNVNSSDFTSDQLYRNWMMSLNMLIKLEHRLANDTKTEEKNQITKYKTLKTIGLFAEKDFGFIRQTDACATVDLTSNGDMTLTANMSAILRKRLAEGKEKNALIDVTGFRGIGKTYNLIEFAKANNYVVITSEKEVLYFGKKYDCNYIFSQRESLRGLGKFYVVDEGVDLDYLQNDLGLNIVTGYISSY